MICVQGCRVVIGDREICRDASGKPRIVQPDGKVRSYARASSHGDALDDKNGLIPWSQACAVRGALDDSDLAYEFLRADDGWVTQESKTATKTVIKKLAVKGGSETKANRGTDLHRWSELLDRGEDLGYVPPEFSADLGAYQYATEDVTHLLIERFSVLDERKIAGTPDRISFVPWPDPDGVIDNRVVDLKTGSMGFPHKMAVQLAIYSRSELYTQNPDATATRERLPQVNQRWALILNLPAGSGQATWSWIDIDAGWTAVREYIPVIKTWRSRKDLLVPVAV